MRKAPLQRGPRIGFGYSGLGQHDKAIALMQPGIAKGGFTRKEDANLHLGDGGAARRGREQWDGRSGAAVVAGAKDHC